jgi:hypothetical protein
MNAYRAMGATGYLFKNDSTSPKIHFLNFRALVFTAFFLRPGRDRLRDEI